MPKSSDILSGLHAIANEYTPWAIVWHVVFYSLAIALITSWEPSSRLTGILICLPIFSVAIFALLRKNPFNGSIFMVIAVLVLYYGLKLPVQPIILSQMPYMVAGIVMIVFGLVYPHFLETRSITKYLYASPAGLIPCPTLSLLIGIMLMFDGIGSQAINLILIVSGLFYGIFGVLKLKVFPDLFLVLGTLVLLAKYVSVN